MAARKTETRQTLSVPEAAARLGISRQLGYEAAATGQLPVIRVGRRLLVPVAALDRMLAGDQPQPTPA